MPVVMEHFVALRLLKPLLNIPSALELYFEGMTEAEREPLLRYFADLCVQEFKRSGLDLDLDNAITVLDRFVVISTRRLQFEEGLAIMLLCRFERTQSLPELDRAIGLLRLIISSTTNSAISPAQQAVLGGAILSRARLTGSVDDIDCSIILQLFAVIRTPQTEKESRRNLLDNLCAALMMRFYKSRVLENLDGAIMMAKESLILTPRGHPERSVSLNNLGAVLRTMYSKTQSTDALHNAIKASTEAVASMPTGYPHANLCLDNLGVVLWLRFECYASMDDLDSAINVFYEALTCTSHDHANRCNILHHLAVALRERFEREGTVPDLERAIALDREAIAITSKHHPDKADFLNGLGCTLWRQFGCNKSVTILDEAVAMHQQAIGIVSSKHRNYGRYLLNLSNAFQLRAAWTDSMNDFDFAVQASEKALLVASSDGRHYPSGLDNLGVALLHRSNHVGSTCHDDLDRSISFLQLAVKSEVDNSFQRRRYLNNLGSARAARFNRFGSLDDLNAAISIAREVVKTAPVNCPDYASFVCNLGLSLQARFERTKSRADIDEGILLIQEAVSNTPKGFAKRNDYIDNLISALAARFQDGGSIEDVDRAILMGKAAIGSIENHAQLVPFRKILSSTSAVLGMRFKLAGDLGDLEDAIEAGEKAISVTPKEHPDLTWGFNNLGSTFTLKYTRTGSLDDLERSVAAKEQAVGIVNGSPSTRIEIALSAVKVIKDHDLPRANCLLQSAVKLLPLVSPRALKQSDQQYNLSRFVGLTSWAVSVALECGEDYYNALQLSEIGRGILADLRLETRSDISDLRAARPDLASKFDEIRDRYDRPTAEVRESYSGLKGQQYITNGKDLEDVLYSIRQEPGFERFLLGLSQPEWEALPKGGAIVIFNVSERRSDAFIVQNHEIRCLQLSTLTLTELILHAERFETAVRSMRTPKNYGKGNREMKEVLEWLWDTTASPILESLGFRQNPSETELWPRVWWIGGDVLSILPIHAAGYHGSNSTRTVLDRVISSYASTGKSLACAWEKYSRATTSLPQKILLVAMPQTPGQQSLPYVKVEIESLNSMLHSSPTILSNPTSQDVLDAMPHHHVLHLSCHGVSEKDPSQSKLLLSDWKTNPLTVAKITSLNLHQTPHFAFLSACETARMLDPRLLDESIHLASAVQLAGYPSVVATLWGVGDTQSATIALEVYRWMQKDGILDSGRSAEALHRAVRLLRETDGPLKWASYIHLGV
jgi:tetratricopeptide (TPR) repeat protein